MTADTQNPGGWPDAERPGVPTNPERDGWHWVQAHKKLDAFMFRNPWRWRAASQTWSLADDTETPAEEARVCHYLGPCLLPSEVAARVAARLRSALEKIAHSADYGMIISPDGDRHQLAIDIALEALGGSNV